MRNAIFLSAFAVAQKQLTVVVGVPSAFTQVLCSAVSCGAGVSLY